jgi:hypothetical protein
MRESRCQDGKAGSSPAAPARNDKVICGLAELVERTPGGADGASEMQGVPFGFAQGRLSTAVVLRFAKAQSSLRMTLLKVRLCDVKG